jgi:hypothetical protein
MKSKVVLPDDNKEEQDGPATYADIIEAGLVEAEKILQEQEDEIKKLNEAAANLNQRRIAALAQRGLLLDLKGKFKLQ